MGRVVSLENTILPTPKKTISSDTPLIKNIACPIHKSTLIASSAYFSQSCSRFCKPMLVGDSNRKSSQNIRTCSTVFVHTVRYSDMQYGIRTCSTVFVHTVRYSDMQYGIRTCSTVFGHTVRYSDNSDSECIFP